MKVSRMYADMIKAFGEDKQERKCGDCAHLTRVSANRNYYIRALTICSRMTPCSRKLMN